MADEAKLGNALVLKIVGGAVLVVGIGALIWWFRLSAEQQAAWWLAVKNTFLWFAFMFALPWGLFFLPGVVARMDSNRMSAALLAGLGLVDLLVLLWLWGWSVGAAVYWVLLMICVLLSTAYNYVVAESLARYAER